MKKSPIALAAIALAGNALLAACATPAFVSPVEVTRFAAADAAQLGRGTIHLEPAPGTDGSAREYLINAHAVARELQALGYTIVAGNGAQVALLRLEHAVIPPERRSPVSIGGGGSVGSYGSGMGLGIGIDLTPGRGEAVTTRLAVTIRAANADGNQWEGRAEMSATANSDYGTAEAAATRMAAALFGGFPGQSGETILVP